MMTMSWLCATGSVCCPTTMRNGTRQLIDVTVARSTSLTELRHGTDTSGPHMLVAARDAEGRKLRTYSAACARAGWAMVPFALESYGGKGQHAAELLQRMATHSLERSLEAFLVHAERVLSVALQSGNASVAGQGTAELHLQAPRRSRLTDGLPSAAGGDSSGRSPRKQYRSAAEQISPLLCVRGGQLDPGSLLHGEYHSARIGVRQPPRVQFPVSVSSVVPVTVRGETACGSVRPLRTLRFVCG